jgi:hypothetical protein
LSQPSWLQPELNFQDLKFLSQCGITNSDNLRCAACGREFQENVEFLILRDGTMVHKECIP